MTCQWTGRSDDYGRLPPLSRHVCKSGSGCLRNACSTSIGWTSERWRDIMNGMKQADSTLNIVVEMPMPGALLFKLSGSTGAKNNPLSIGVIRDALDQATEVRMLSFESVGVTAWDSHFVAFIRKCAELCRKRNIELRDDGLPQGVRRLLRLAQ